MPKTIISDTSCFIILSKIDELELLHKVYPQIITTPDIAAEFGSPLPEWVEIIAVSDKQKQKLLETQLDKGESSALALALELVESVVIIDDYKARKIAEQLNIAYTGTVGVVIKAKLQGIITSIKPILEKIKQQIFVCLPKLN